MLRFVPIAVVFTIGCAHAPIKLQSIEMEPMKIEVARDGKRVEAFDAATLFEQAGADLNQQHFAEAARAYQRLVSEFSDSRYAVAALYNSGLAHEGLKDFAGAVASYRRLIEQHEATKDALDALFRMGGCYAELQNWAASSEAFSRVLSHQGLSVGDYVEASARRGLAQFNMKDYAASERTLRDGYAFYKKNETVERLDNDFFLAMTQYYLAEISHVQFRSLPVRLPQELMQKDLEAKAELLLVTQGRYVDVARIKNPGWATAAGYQMAMLYREFYDSLMSAPIPPELSGEAKQVYLEELRKTIEPLLRKAIHAHELTQQVAERNGVDNEWVRKSNAEMEQLRALLGVPPLRTPSESPRRPANERIQQPPTPPRNEEYHPRVIL